MIRALAGLVAVLSLIAGTGTPPAGGTVPAATSFAVAGLRPPIVWKPIPFGARRKAEMAAYSKRHYGRYAWRLRDPKVIIEHYTAGMTWQGRGTRSRLTRCTTASFPARVRTSSSTGTERSTSWSICGSAADMPSV
jgi:hypothetical protein